MKFSELIRLLERNGFTLLREKGSIRYYSKPAMTRSFVLTIMAQKKSLPGLVMLSLKLLELERHDD